MLKKYIKLYKESLDLTKTGVNFTTIESYKNNLDDFCKFIESSESVIMNSNDVDMLEQYFLELKMGIHGLHKKGNAVLEKIYEIKDKGLKK